MKFVLKPALYIVLFVGANQVAAVAQTTGPVSDVPTGLATLFARDPLTQSLCFKDGLPGKIFQHRQQRNRCSDLDFGSYSANAFSAGIEGGKHAIILDLGPSEDLPRKYGFSETNGFGQGFASISIRGRKALILKDYKTGELQEISESARLFSTPIAGHAAPVKLGHVYLIRTTDRHDASYESFAKVLVVAYTPGESVTIRWSLLSDSATAKLDPKY